MRKNLAALTAHLYHTEHGPLASRLPRFLWEEGQPPEDEKLSRREWEERRSVEVAKKSHAELAAKVAQLERDNLDLRKRVLPEGAVVLTPDEVKVWEQYKTLGRPEEVKTKLQERDQFETESRTLKRDQLFTDVATEMKWKPSVLKKIAGEAEFTIRDGKDGKKEISIKDGDKETPVEEYAKANWDEFMPSLQAGEPERKVPTGGAGGKNNAGVDPVTAYMSKTYGTKKEQ